MVPTLKKTSLYGTSAPRNAILHPVILGCVLLYPFAPKTWTFLIFVVHILVNYLQGWASILLKRTGCSSKKNEPCKKEWSILLKRTNCSKRTGRSSKKNGPFKKEQSFLLKRTNWTKKNGLFFKKERLFKKEQSVQKWAIRLFSGTKERSIR